MVWVFWLPLPAQAVWKLFWFASSLEKRALQSKSKRYFYIELQTGALSWRLYFAALSFHTAWTRSRHLLICCFEIIDARMDKISDWYVGKLGSRIGPSTRGFSEGCVTDSLANSRVKCAKSKRATEFTMSMAIKSVKIAPLWFESQFEWSICIEDCSLEITKAHI